MIRHGGRLVGIATIAAALGCGDRATDPTPPLPPPPATGIVSLTTPHPDDGAVIVTLSGPGLSAMQSSDTNHVIYSRLVNGEEARVIVVGDLTAGPLFTFALGTGAQLSAYTATLQQVATRADSLRTSTAGYRLIVTAAP